VGDHFHECGDVSHETHYLMWSSYDLAALICEMLLTSVVALLMECSGAGTEIQRELDLSRVRSLAIFWIMKLYVSLAI